MEDEKYLGRITSEHRIRPKFMAWAAALLARAEDAEQAGRGFDEQFDLNAGCGAQLDILGEIVGVPRLLTFQPRYAAPLLSDEYYRMVLRAKISLNQWDGTTQGIIDLWASIYKDYTMEIIDHQDMSVTLRIINMNSLFESEFISRGYLAPKPESVRINYEFVLTRKLEEKLNIAGRLGYMGGRFALTMPEAAFQMRGGEIHAAGRISLWSRFHLPAPIERGSVNV